MSIEFAQEQLAQILTRNHNVGPVYDASQPPVQPQRPAYQQRVIEEYSDLSTKLLALQAFVGGPLFPPIPEVDQYLLRHQARVMGEYQHVLAERIRRFDQVSP